MRQVVQSVSGGPIRVVDVPRPEIGPTEVLVQTRVSVISPGTERAVTELARSSLIAKARSRPDLVRQVVNKARAEGVGHTIQAVRSRLDADMPLGYSAAGIALEVGEAVADIHPGDHVATGGAGYANHAELQAVPGLLCARVPDGVALSEASFATLASVPMNALRLADLGPGSRVVVVGLGLVGQLALRLARASGYLAAGIDVSRFPVERAGAAGFPSWQDGGEDTTRAVLDWSRGRGADAVLITAGGSSSEAVSRAPELCRDRAVVIVVGDVGLNVPRTPYYAKELTLRLARSYGPGRYERSYEEWGVDYPPGFVRWTERRNLESVLDLIERGSIGVADLVTHEFDIGEATRAYELIQSRDEPYLAVQLTYPSSAPESGPVEIAERRRTDAPGLGLVGAGAFTRSVLLPALQTAGFERLVAVASASGVSARHLAERAGIEKATTAADLIADPEVDVVVVATPHDSHARFAVQALRAGKHVFCEKPLALTEDELDEVEAAWRDAPGVLFVGFNRRWSPALESVRDHFARGTGPLVMSYRINAGSVPPDHWYNDRRQGGRLVGEVCHFIDACGSIVREPATDVQAYGSGGAELLLASDIALTLRYADGSVATISYASEGHPSVEKERLEILGRGRSATVIDYKSVVLDGKATSLRSQDKGHERQLRAFREAVGGGPAPTPELLSSMRTTLRAAASLTGSTAR